MVRPMRGRSGLPALRLFAVSAAGTLAFLLAAGPAAAETLSPLNHREARLLDKMNDVRRNHGLRPLRLSERLEDAAARHAKSMGRKGYALHDLYTPLRSDNWTPLPTWLRWYWPGPGYTSWWMGENIAWGAPDLTTRRAMYFWMHSAPHRANILGNFNRVGIEAVRVQDPSGTFRSYSDVTVWSVDLGKRS
jgi:uncharacterized protein YkwD